MTFLKNKNFYLLPTVLLLVILYQCTSKKNIAGMRMQLDTLEIDGVFFSNERMYVKANDSIIFEKTIITSKKMISVHDYLVIPKWDTIKLSIQTFIGTKKYIDTTFVITSSFGGVRAVGGSICYPKDLPISSLIDKEPDWSYLPPDSCKRYISIQSDTVKYMKY